MSRSVALIALLVYALVCAGQKPPPNESTECPAGKVRVPTAYGSYCGGSPIVRDAPQAYIDCNGLTYIPAYSAADGVFGSKPFLRRAGNGAGRRSSVAKNKTSGW
jgi:hypothetical protein